MQSQDHPWNLWDPGRHENLGLLIQKAGGRAEYTKGIKYAWMGAPAESPPDVLWNCQPGVGDGCHLTLPQDTADPN